MNAIDYIQILGYSAAALVIISFVYKPSHYIMRLINSLGCFLFIFFGVLINNEKNYGMPIILANATVLFLNLIYYFSAKNRVNNDAKEKNKSINNSSV
ncbi:MAG: hypothetical protein ACRCR9_05615 [Chitinophagaceae bacterium]